MAMGCGHSLPDTPEFSVPFVKNSDGQFDHNLSAKFYPDNIAVNAPRSRPRRSRNRSRLPEQFVQSEWPSSEKYNQPSTSKGLGTSDNLEAKMHILQMTLKMEALMLEESPGPMPRCSTPSDDICFHCDHNHMGRCCLYVCDTTIDGIQYARWKYDLEQPQVVRSQYVSKIPEAISGMTTPLHFPTYTYKHPELINPKPNIYQPPIPTVWIRQYIWPYNRINWAWSSDDTVYRILHDKGIVECQYLFYKYQYYRYHESHLPVLPKPAIPPRKPHQRNARIPKDKIPIINTGARWN